MQRKPRLTKKERKALAGPKPASTQGRHIHCVGCGVHLDPAEFDRAVPTATWLTCKHGSTFASCVGCTGVSQGLLDEHDRLGQPVRAASAWH